MFMTRRKCLLPLAALVMSGAFTSQAQTGSSKTDAYLAAFKQESQRHANVMTKLQNDRLEATKQRIDAEIDCRAMTSPASRKTCMDTAKTNYGTAIRKIEKAENDERTLHDVNDNNLRRTMDESCTRPDCANSSPKQRAPCTGTSCQQFVDGRSVAAT
jgi:hypothetical protein